MDSRSSSRSDESGDEGEGDGGDGNSIDGDESDGDDRQMAKVACVPYQRRMLLHTAVL